MTPERDYYRLLHVQPDAPMEVIRSSYRTLMQRMRAHPDLGGDNRQAAELNEAWRVLRHADKRAAYDAARAAGPTARRARPDPATPAAGACLFCGTGHEATVRSGDRCVECSSPLMPADRSRLENDGQRRIGRIRRSHPLTFWTKWPQRDTLTGRMRDISLHGVKFATAGALAIGQILRIDSDICHAVARVVATQPDSGRAGGGWLVRAEFLTMDLEQTVGTFVSEIA